MRVIYKLRKLQWFLYLIPCISINVGFSHCFILVREAATALIRVFAEEPNVLSTEQKDAGGGCGSAGPDAVH